MPKSRSTRLKIVGMEIWGYQANSVKPADLRRVLKKGYYLFLLSNDFWLKVSL